jgi:hypothetical protein
MLSLDDPRWKRLKGGLGGKFDASVLLRRLYAGDDSEDTWNELSLQLHHQGDVYSAAYAAMPHLLEIARRRKKLTWQVFSLIELIEHCRPSNPPPSKLFAKDYFRTVQDAAKVALGHPDQEWNEWLTASVCACLALAKSHRVMSAIIVCCVEPETKRELFMRFTTFDEKHFDAVEKGKVGTWG